MKKWQIFLLFVSLSLSVFSLVLTLFKIIPTVTFTGETYVGVLATLMGICVAIILGYQIVNSNEMKKKIAKLEELESEVIKTKKELTETGLYSEYNLFWNSAISLQDSNRNVESLIQYIKSFYALARRQHSSDIDTWFENFKMYRNGFKKKAELPKEHPEYQMFFIKNSECNYKKYKKYHSDCPKEIEDQNTFQCYRKRYYEIKNDIDKSLKKIYESD